MTGPGGMRLDEAEAAAARGAANARAQVLRSSIGALRSVISSLTGPGGGIQDQLVSSALADIADGAGVLGERLDGAVGRIAPAVGGMAEDIEAADAFRA